MFVGLGVNAADSADTTTVLQPGDRPFIDRQSVVFYADALPVNLGALDRAVAAGVERARGRLCAAGAGAHPSRYGALAGGAQKGEGSLPRRSACGACLSRAPGAFEPLSGAKVATLLFGLATLVIVWARSLRLWRALPCRRGCSGDSWRHFHGRPEP
jgi:hypothetical protein